MQVSSASAAALQSDSVFIIIADYTITFSSEVFGSTNSMLSSIQIAYEMNAVGNGPNGPTNGIYTLTDYHSGMLMEVAGASTSSLALIDQAVSDSDTNQEWYVNYLGNSRYSLLNVNSLLALTIQSYSATQGTDNVIQYALDYHQGGTDQLFTLTQQPNSSFNMNAVCTGLSLSR